LRGNIGLKNAICWQQCFFITHAPFQARGKAGGAVRTVREMETYKNKQIVTNIFVSVQQQY